MRAPEPPPGLGPAGLAFWDAAWRLGHLDARADAPLVGLVADEHDLRERLRAEAEDPDAWRARVALARVDELIAAGLDALGMSPASRRRHRIESTAATGRLAALRAARKAAG